MLSNWTAGIWLDMGKCACERGVRLESSPEVAGPGCEGNLAVTCHPIDHQS